MAQTTAAEIISSSRLISILLQPSLQGGSSYTSHHLSRFRITVKKKTGLSRHLLFQLWPPMAWLLDKTRPPLLI